MRCRSLLALGLILGALSCRKVDVRTAKIHVPGMKNRACAELIVRRLAGVPGVKADQIRVDFSTRDVTVLYDSLKLSMKNVEFQIAKLGFQANEIPAKKEAAAKLPPECR